MPNGWASAPPGAPNLLTAIGLAAGALLTANKAALDAMMPELQDSIKKGIDFANK